MMLLLLASCGSKEPNIENDISETAGETENIDTKEPESEIVIAANDNRAPKIIVGAGLTDATATDGSGKDGSAKSGVKDSGKDSGKSSGSSDTGKSEGENPTETFKPSDAGNKKTTSATDSEQDSKG